jgi:hypothetical protein
MVILKGAKIDQPNPKINLVSRERENMPFFGDTNIKIGG